MACASLRAMANDARDACRDALWPELVANLLPRRSADARQQRGTRRHLGELCHADGAQRRWHPAADRGRKPAELDQDQTPAAATIVLNPVDENEKAPLVIHPLCTTLPNSSGSRDAKPTHIVPET